MPAGRNVTYNHNVVVAFSAVGQQGLAAATAQANRATTDYSRNLQTNVTQLTNNTRAQDTFRNSTVQTGRSVATLGNTFSAGLAPSIKSAGAPLANLNQQLTQNVGGFKRLGAALKENIVSVGLSAAGVVGLINQYTQLEKRKVMVERTALAEKRAHEKVHDITVKLNAAVKEGGANSTKALELSKDLAIAQEAEGVATERHSILQQQYNELMSEFTFTIIPNGIIAVTGITSALSNAGISLNGVKGILPAVSGGFLTLAGAEDAAALSARGLAIAVGTIAAPLIALKAAFDILPKTEDFKKQEQVFNDVNSTIREKLLAQKAQYEHLLQPFDITNMDTWATAYQKLRDGITDEDLKSRLKEINDLLAKGDAGLVNLDVTVTTSTEDTAGFNTAAEYQSRVLDNVTSAADEAAHGLTNEANATGMTTSYIDSLNEALDYQNRSLNNVGSAADEAAAGLTNEANHTGLTKEYMDSLNRALDYQDGSFRNITSQADEVAAGYNEVNSAAGELNLTLDDFNNMVKQHTLSGSLLDTFNIDVDQNKINKKILDYIPDKIVKELKLDLKTDVSVDKSITGIMDTIFAAIGDPKMTEKKMDKIVSGAMKYLQEKFPNDPRAVDAANQLANTLYDPLTGKKLDDTEARIAGLMAKWDAKPIKVTIDPETLKALGTIVQQAFNGSEITVPITPEWVGSANNKNKVKHKPFTKDEWNNLPDSFTSQFPSSDPNRYHPWNGYDEFGNYWSKGKITGRAGHLPANPPGWDPHKNPGNRYGTGTEPGFLTGVSFGGKGGGGGGTSNPEVQAQKLQTALANLAIQGSNSLSILAKSSSVNMKGLSNNLKVGEVESQKLQTGVANLANEGANSFAILAKGSSKSMQGFRNNLKVGEVQAQKLQTGIANLANQGSNSLSILAKSSSKNMNGFVNNLKKGEAAVKDLKSAISSLKSKTVTVSVKVSGDSNNSKSSGNGNDQHGGYIIQNAANGVEIITQPRIINGVRTGEHSKPELLTITPLTNPSNVADRSINVSSPGGSDSGMSKQFMQNILDAIQSIKMTVMFQLDGNDIVRTKDIFATVSPLMGKTMAKYGGK